MSTSTGVITGTVTDATGGVLTGAAVTLTSPALMGARVTRTTNAGSFRFPALPPGTYTLALAAEGFTPVERGGLYVAAGFTATVDVTMHLREVADAVNGREAPQLGRRLEAAHLALALSGRLVRDLGAVVGRHLLADVGQRGEEAPVPGGLLHAEVRMPQIQLMEFELHRVRR